MSPSPPPRDRRARHSQRDKTNRGHRHSSRHRESNRMSSLHWSPNRWCDSFPVRPSCTDTQTGRAPHPALQFCSSPLFPAIDPQVCGAVTRRFIESSDSSAEWTKSKPETKQQIARSSRGVTPSDQALAPVPRAVSSFRYACVGRLDESSNLLHWVFHSLCRMTPGPGSGTSPN